MMVAAAGLLVAAASAQDETKRYKTGQIKVGDRVLADSVGLEKFDTCTVIGAYRPG